MRKIYVYPKLSGIDCLLFRIGGDGMGNLLFTYFDAFIFCKENDCQFIWPTWMSLKIGPWIRREKDKRLYCGLYTPENWQIAGIKKVLLLLFSKKVKADLEMTNFNDFDLSEKEILVWQKCNYKIETFIPYRDEIKNHIWSITNPRIKEKVKALYIDEKTVHLHVRMGDFQEINNTTGERFLLRSPIDWFVNCVRQISEMFHGRISFLVFSDGTDDELKELLKQPNTKRVETGTSIGDILALSMSKLIIATGASTFSLWARFLGNTSCLCYEKDPIYKVNTFGGFECGIGYELSEEIMKQIKNLYNDTGESKDET